MFSRHGSCSALCLQLLSFSPPTLSLKLIPEAEASPPAAFHGSLKHVPNPLARLRTLTTSHHHNMKTRVGPCGGTEWQRQTYSVFLHWFLRWFRKKKRFVHQIQNSMDIIFCVCAKSLQLCPTLCNPMDCSLPGSSVHGILQARILERVSISFSRGSSQPRNWTPSLMSPALAVWFFTTSGTWEALLNNIIV